MFEDIDKAAECLKDAKAGWVHRRDAADALGEAAARALGVLNAHKDEADVDVRDAVTRALAPASAALAGIEPASRVGKQSYSLDALVKACGKPGRRTVEKAGGAYVVEVALKGGRKQQVRIASIQGSQKTKLIRVSTSCGASSDKALAWALRANARLAQGALALIAENGEERFVLANNFIEGEVTPREMTTAVKALAYYGDWVEKLSGLDEF